MVCSSCSAVASHNSSPSQRCYCCPHGGFFGSCGGRPSSCSTRNSRCCSAGLASCHNSSHLLMCGTPAITCNGIAISPCGGSGHCSVSCNGHPLVYATHSHCNSRGNCSTLSNAGCNTSGSNVGGASRCCSHNSHCGTLNYSGKTNLSNPRHVSLATGDPLYESPQRTGDLEPMLSTPGSPPPPAPLDQRSEHKVSLFSII
ncbi:CD59 antigen conserved site [Trinorchestia longiramus]|nr:CD59 antigen conserved site [Trinorchestia longiramus]